MVMDSIHIVNGFSDIKRQFINKRRLQKEPHELRLWFSLSADVLFVHDYDVHEKSMVMAIFEGEKGKCYLETGDHAIHVYELALRMGGKIFLAKNLNTLFESHGTF
jgi:hypothetical protein